MKIIIADDESSALHVFLDEIVGLEDIEYKFFRGGGEAVCAYVKENKTDAAFLDMKMPDINGIELAQKLIAINNTNKIVFITGLTLTEKELPPDVKEHTLGIMYKPYDSSELINYINIIADVTPTLTVTTFDTFDCKLNGRAVEFSSAKSKELFALLIVYNGKPLTMADAISQLWPDHDVEKAKILYRDAVWRLRKALQKVNFNCVIFSRGELALVKDNIACDYWDVSEGKKPISGADFLKNYDWSLQYIAGLD